MLSLHFVSHCASHHITPSTQVPRSLFFSFFFRTPQRQAKLKQELSLNHLQHPITCCGLIQGEIDTSPSRILLRLLRDTLLLRIGRVVLVLGPSRR
jgi:hypothetical protein